MARESINALRQMFQLAFRQQVRPIGAALADLPAEIRAVPEVQEVMAFVQSSKRGIAVFQSWSDRAAGSSKPSE
jgi:acyl-[acyl carrier protein]--UDP-N-acetylglucosamine O-acyltransferase